MYLLQHASIKHVAGLMDARCIHKNDLRGRALTRLGFFGWYLDDSMDAVARGLGLTGDNRYFFAGEGIQQRGLAGVGAADDGDESGAHFHSLVSSGRCEMRMRSMRRSVEARISKRSPSSSMTSPAIGMRPASSLTRP